MIPDLQTSVTAPKAARALDTLDRSCDNARMASTGPRWVGRDRELGDLASLWDAVLGGQAAAACITGPHFSGRSWLLGALAAAVKDRTPNARIVALCPCPATAGGMAMAARFLADLLDLSPDDPELPARVSRLSGSTGDALAYHVSLVLHVFGRDSADSLNRAIDPQAAAQAFVTDLALAAAARRPTLLLADDLHRADSVSWAWVAHLLQEARARHSPLMLAASTLDARHGELAWLQEACGARALVLQPALAAQAAAAGVARDLSRLAAASRALVDAAAVAGGPLDLALLAAVAEIADPAAALSGADPLYLDTAGVWFRQSGAVEIAFDLLAPAARIALHRRLGVALEPVAPRFAALHFERGAERKGLLRALTAAASAARSRFDLEGARALLERALNTSDAESAPGDVVVALAEILVTLGSYDAALGLLARHTIRLLGPLRAHAYRLTGRALERKGEYAAAKAHHLEGLADPDLSPSERGALLAELATILVRQGDYSEARRHADQALAAAPREASGPEVALAQSVLGICHYRQGRFDQALEAHRRALALRERSGDLTGVANSLNNLGNVLSDSGDWDNALATFTRALGIAQIAGDARTRTALRNNIAALHLARGDLDAAANACQASLDGKTRDGETPGRGIALATMAAVRARQGRLDEALSGVEEALGLLESLGERETLADVRAAHGELLMRKGAYDAAWISLRRGLDLAEESGKVTVVARVYRLYSELSELEGRASEGLVFAREAVELSRLVRRPVELARSLRQLARMEGDPEGPAGQEAAELFARLGIASGAAPQP